MADRRLIAATVAQGAGLTFVGLLAVAVAGLITIALLVPPRTTMTAGFFWSSVGVLLLTYLAMGLLAGRRSPERLRKAGVREGWPRYVLAASGPTSVAVITGLTPAVGLSPILSLLAPVCLTAAGAALGAHLSRS